MEIQILCIGKLKEQYLRDACQEYIKRLSRFANVKVQELSEYKLPDAPSDAELQRAVAEESLLLLKNIKKPDMVYAADIGGKRFSSEGFAEDIQKRMTGGAGRLVFVIGGSNGFSDDVRKRADVKISFSDMTFPHQLFRVMLLEQIYRAFKIISGEKYHK